jgi:RHS repeat-associated protein
MQYRLPDPVGNLYRTPDRSDRSYGHGGVLRQADGIRYVHDADGNMTQKILPDGKTWSYRWDGAGQLREVVRPDGGIVTFAYDALGRRVRKTSDGQTISYVWDGNDVVHEARPNHNVITWEFEPETFAPLAKIEGSQCYGIVGDHLGTPIALFDRTGEIAWNAELDIYGSAQVDVARTTCPWRRPGQYEDDDLQLFYNRYRFYDPHRGSYTTQDPIGLAGGNHLYQYSPDTLLWIDPLGLNCGRRGERIAREYLKKQGYEVLGSIQNKSGHGIDLVTRNTKGELVFFEIKSTLGNVAPSLSQAQRLGAQSFVWSRLQRAVGWNATFDPNTNRKAADLIREIIGNGGPSTIQGHVIKIIEGKRSIVTASW